MACVGPCSCCKGACCNAGSCSQETCADCEAAGGTYKGAATDCGDYDCTDGCCEGKACIDDSGNTSYTKCEFGYFASECPGGNCTPGTPATYDSFPVCQEGLDYPTSVTGSGFVGISGDPTFDALAEECFNNTYNITRDCCNGGEWNGSSCTQLVKFPLSNPDYEAWVTFPAVSNGARLVNIDMRYLTSTTAASAFRNEGAYSSAADPCGNTLYDCSESVNGAPSGSTGPIDITGATLSAA